MENTAAIFSAHESPAFTTDMEFPTGAQLEDIEQGALCMDAISSGVTMATVTISHQDIQAMTENASATVRYDGENAQNQVMSLFLQTDAATDLQHITSLAEQQGISIMQEPAPQGMELKVENDVMEVQTSEQVGGAQNEGDDTASLLAKLEANNPQRNNVVQLTSDGKIIKGLEVERVVDTQCVDENSGSDVKSGRLLQQITLADGMTAYIQHPGQAETLQAVRLTDGTLAYLTSELLQPASITATVNLNLQPGQDQEKQHDKAEGTVEATNWITQLNKGIEDGGESGSNDVTMAQPHEAGDTERTVQVSMAGGQQKTIRVQLAEESAHTLGIDDKVYKCLFEGCGKIYTSHHHLKVHQRSHTGDRPYICDDVTCQKAFATAYGLKSHRRTHTGEKPYRCGQEGCGKAFKTSGDLQKHTRTHTGEKPFVCPFEGCNKRFTTSNIRKVHIRVHTGERPYQCPVPECSKKFSSATNYKNHIRIHTGERPYVCTVPGCGKRFTEYSSLYKHHVVHTHSKPYVCRHCGKTYRQTSTLAMHKRQAHNDDSPLSDLEIALVLQTNPPPPDPKANYMPETDIGEGALVINTSDNQASQSSDAPHNINEYTEVTQEEPRVPGVLGTSTVNTSVSTAASTATSKPNISIVMPARQAGGELTNQRLFIIADPSQTQAVLQQIAGQRVDLQQIGLENLTTSQVTKQTDITGHTIKQESCD